MCLKSKGHQTYGSERLQLQLEPKHMGSRHALNLREVEAEREGPTFIRQQAETENKSEREKDTK
jgi:hypothetical protein